MATLASHEADKCRDQKRLKKSSGTAPTACARTQTNIEFGFLFSFDLKMRLVLVAGSCGVCFKLAAAKAAENVRESQKNRNVLFGFSCCSKLHVPDESSARLLKARGSTDSARGR